jgi:hypothetical protein
MTVQKKNQHYEIFQSQNVPWLSGGFRSVVQFDNSTNENCNNDINVHVHVNNVPSEPKRSPDSYVIDYHEDTNTFTYNDPWHSHETAMANPSVTNEYVTPITTSVITHDINKHSGADSNSFTEPISQPEPASANSQAQVQVQVHETQPFHQEVKEVSSKRPISEMKTTNSFSSTSEPM